MGQLTHAQMDQRIRSYFDACNEGDVEKIASHFVTEGVHYFPPGMYMGPFRGAHTIGERWKQAVGTFGSVWTVDQVITDPATARAVVEWTHFKTFKGVMLRGDEWYQFDLDSGLIVEIRAYYASPQDVTLSSLELEGFDYEARGYPLTSPIQRAPEGSA